MFNARWEIYLDITSPQTLNISNIQKLKTNDFTENKSNILAMFTL